MSGAVEPSGVTLDVALQRGAFHPLRTIRAGRDISAILAVQHERGVAHGSVGPQDVLLGDDGIARLSQSEDPAARLADDVRDLGAMLSQALAPAADDLIPEELPPLLDAMQGSAHQRPSIAQVRDALTRLQVQAERPVSAESEAEQTPDDPDSSGRLRTVLTALLALVVVAALIAGVILLVQDDDTSEPSGTGTATPEATATPSVVEATGPSAGPTSDLIQRIQPPPGPARQLDDDANNLGPLTAAQLVRLGGGTEQEQTQTVQALDQLGFQAAHARAWSLAEGQTYSVVVYRFATVRGAQALLERLSPQRSGERFESRTVRNAVAYSRRNGAAFEQAGSFTRGQYFYDVILSLPVAEPGHEMFDALLSAQRDRAERFG